MLATTVEFVFRILVYFVGLAVTMDGVTVAESETVVSDETLTEAIRKYPIIYNKNTKGYKDTHGKKKMAWEKVVKECGLSDVAEGIRLFENIKKKFNTRRRSSKGPSGSGTADVSSQQEDFKDMAYLSWLAPHVKLRKTKSNVSFKEMSHAASKNTSATVSEDEDDQWDDILNETSVVERTLDNEYTGIDNEGHEDDENAEKESTMPTNAESVDLLLSGKTIDQLKNLGEPSKRSNGKSRQSKPSKISETTHRAKWHQKKDDMDTVQKEFLKVAKDALKSSNNAPSKENLSPNTAFGNYIVSELDQLSPYLQKNC